LVIDFTKLVACFSYHLVVTYCDDKVNFLIDNKQIVQKWTKTCEICRWFCFEWWIYM